MHFNGALMEAEEKEAQAARLLGEAKLLRQKAEELGWEPPKKKVTKKSEPATEEPVETTEEPVEVKVEPTSSKSSKEVAKK